MKLMDFADVNPDNRRWSQGYNETGRECAVTVQMTEVCVADPDTPETIVLVEGSPGDLSEYFVAPWAAEAILQLPVWCARDDDTERKWLESAMVKVRELVFGRALVIQATSQAATWINGAGVQTQAIAGNTAANWRTAITDGRKLWHDSVVDPHPKVPGLHIPPSLVPLIKDSGVINALGEGDFETVWGDPVVISEGYDRTTPNVFWSGYIRLYYEAVEGLGPHRLARQNTVQFQANEAYSIELNPCTIVRIGDYTA